MKNYMKKVFLLTISVLLLIGCLDHSKQNKKAISHQDVTTIPSNDKSSQSILKSTCYIDTIYITDDQYYLTISYIEFLTGDKALSAAKKAGEAEMEISNGDTIYYVYDDYYIQYADKQPDTFRISNQPDISIIVYDSTSWTLQSNMTVHDLISMKFGYKNRPFNVEINNNFILKLSEIYTP